MESCLCVWIETSCIPCLPFNYNQGPSLQLDKYQTTVQIAMGSSPNQGGSLSSENDCLGTAWSTKCVCGLKCHVCARANDSEVYVTSSAGGG